MKIVHSGYGIILELEENWINVLVVEEKKVLVELIQDLCRQCEGEEGGFILSDDGREIDIAKNLSLITDPFSIDCNQRKVLNRLYQEMEKEHLYEMSEEQEAFYSAYLSYVEHVCRSSDFMLTFQDRPGLQEILKLADVKIESTDQSLPEQIAEYIGIMNGLMKQRVFVFLNLKLFLTEWELKELYKACFYKKVHLVLLETVDQGRREEEKVCIIDKEKCVIYT